MVLFQRSPTSTLMKHVYLPAMFLVNQKSIADRIVMTGTKTVLDFTMNDPRK